MKIFDCSELKGGMIFHIQDHDRGFAFIGRLRLKGLDFIRFDVLPINEHSSCKPSCKPIGTYVFNIGSKFTLHGMKWNDERQEYVYEPIISDESIISSEDLETDDDDDVEENNMSEEKNTTDWLPCVVSDGTWRVNTFVNEGDEIYRIFNDKFDIKANMTIKSIGWNKISLHLMDLDVDISNIEVDEKLRVCQTSSENDPGILVVKQNLSFNKEFRSSCLYRVIDSASNFKYLMYIRRFFEGHIDADIMKPIIDEDHFVIETKHEQLSLIDLKDMKHRQNSPHRL